MEYVCPRCLATVTAETPKCNHCKLCFDDDCPLDLKEQYRNGRTCSYEHEEES